MRQRLDGDSALQACVACTIYLAHASGTERREDLIGAELCSRG